MSALKIKEQFLEYSIGGGKVKLVKLKNLNPNEYEKYYELGFSEYFTKTTSKSSKEKPVEELPEIDEASFLNDDIKIEENKDDFNK